MNFLKSAVADNLAHTQHNTRLFLLAIDLPLIVPLNWIDSVDEAMIFIFDILIMFVFTYCHYPGRHVGSEVFCLVGTFHTVGTGEAFKVRTLFIGVLLYKRILVSSGEGEQKALYLAIFGRAVW